MNQLIGGDDYSITVLAQAFSLISDNAMYVPTPVPALIAASKLNNDPSNVLHHHQLPEFISCPQDIIKLIFIRSKNDMINFNIVFSPRHTDLIFGKNKKNFGYKDLNIEIYCLPSSLNFYLGISYDDKINTKKYKGFKADNISNLLNQWMPSTTTRNFDVFLSKLNNENEFIPFGKELLKYKLKGEESSPYFIYRINQNLFFNSNFIDWYSHLNIFHVFFLNTASTITKEDPNWIIYLLYQLYQNDNNQTCYAPIGFITVYLYYAYPDKKRPRVSQMLIFPPYQRKGHGRRFLTTVYNDLREDSHVKDITAENPSNEFIALRDLVSFELCHKYLSKLFSKQSILKTKRLTKAIIDEAQNICKLTKQETRRVYEMFLLQSINENDEKQMKDFRLIIEKRLFNSLRYEKHHDLQLTNPEIRNVYLATEYENVLKSYKSILQTFDKHHSNLYFISNILS